MAVFTREPSIVVSFGPGPTVLPRVLSARTEWGTDIGISSASFVVPTYDDCIGLGLSYWTEVSIQLTAGSNIVVWTGYVVTFQPSYYPRGVTVLCKGYLIKCDIKEMDNPTTGGGTDTGTTIGGMALATPPTGATDGAMVKALLSACGLDSSGAYPYAAVGTTGKTWGTVAATPFIWSTGQTALSFIQQLDSASYSSSGGNFLGWRTWDAAGGVIRREQVDMNPAGIASATFTEGVDIFDAPGQQDVLTEYNKVVVTGYDPGDGSGAVNNTQSSGSADSTLTLNNAMIERQSEVDAGSGMSCEAVSRGLLYQYNFPQWRYTMTTPRDDTIAIGDTIAVTFATGGDGSRFVTPASSGKFWTQHVTRAVDAQTGFTQTLVICRGV